MPLNWRPQIDLLTRDRFYQPADGSRKNSMNGSHFYIYTFPSHETCHTIITHACVCLAPMRTPGGKQSCPVRSLLASVPLVMLDASSLKPHGREGSACDLAERGLEVSLAEIHDSLRAPAMPLILESPLGLDSFHFRNWCGLGYLGCISCLLERGEGSCFKLCDVDVE